jgi:hypothetical protein
MTINQSKSTVLQAMRRVYLALYFVQDFNAVAAAFAANDEFEVEHHAHRVTDRFGVFSYESSPVGRNNDD